MLLVFVSLNNLWSPASQAGETCAKIHIFSVSTGIQHLVFFLLRRIFFSHAPLAYIHPQPCVAIHVMKPPRPPADILPQPSVAIRVMKPPRPPADSNSNYVGFKHGFLVAFYAISCRRKNLFALKGRVWETHRVDKPRMLLRSALGLCTFAPSRCGFMHTLPTSVHKHCSAQLHKLLRQSIGQCIRLKLQYRTVADGCRHHFENQLKIIAK